MLGAIIGDLAGSIYEFGQIKSVSKVKVNKLIENNAFFSDDTILTVAIADAILSGAGYEEKLREYVLKYENLHPAFEPYFKKMFSPGTCKWAKGEGDGQSCGNGAMMRISPAGELFDSEEEVIKNARLATIPSHNSESAINAATLVARIIFNARVGLSKQEIIDKLHIHIYKPEIKSFNYTCDETLDVCLYSLFMADNFEDAIRLAISFGGDTDTNACIVGSMAEALYGIPQELKQQALEKLPKEFISIVKSCEKAKISMDRLYI